MIFLLPLPTRYVHFWQMNYSHVAQELIVALRSRRGQNWLSEKLGFSSNQLYRWEKGLRKISWKDFLRLIEVCGYNSSELLIEIIGYEGHPNESGRLITWLTGHSKINESARSIQISRQAMGRLRRGQTEPSLEMILKIIDVIQNRLIEFCDFFVPAERLETLNEKRDLQILERQLRLQMPVSTVVFACLELNEYRQLERHRPGLIAKLCGISLKEEETILRSLEKTGAIKKNNEIYEVTTNGLELSTESFEDKLRMQLFWSLYAKNFLENTHEPKANSLYGWSVFPISDRGYELLREKLREAYVNIVAIANADKAPKTQVKIINLQCIDLNDYHSVYSKPPRLP